MAARKDFVTLVNEIAMQIAAASPSYVSRSAVPADILDREKSIYRAQMEKENKPAHVIDKIIEGKLGSFYSQFVLVDQPSIRDPAVTIGQLVAQASAKTGENIQVSRFARYRVGETAAE